MSIIINSLSFETYIFIVILLFLGSIFGIYDMRKKKPGHPMTWVLPFSIFLCASLILYRCSLELTNNQIFQEITHIVTIISIICFFISFIITFAIAHKNNYTDKEKLNKLLPLLIGCIIIMIICFVPLLFR